MAESKAENKKVEVVKGEEKNGAVRRPIESANIFTSNGVISFSVWEGGSISVRVSRRKDGSDEYENVWSGRINPVDFISQIGELRTLRRRHRTNSKRYWGWRFNSSLFFIKRRIPMSEVKLSLQNVRSPDWYPKGRKISRHSRKLNGQTFVAPRIILPPDYNDLIGKIFFLWDADVEVEFEEFWRKSRIKGRALILVVPEEVEEIKGDFDDFEESDEFEE